jgi:hypothetical protein
MPKPIKLDDLLRAIRKYDKNITFSTQKGKGSHCVLSKKVGNETRSFTLPTTKPEIMSPYQTNLIRLFDLPADIFEKNKKKKKSGQKKSDK